MRIDMRHNFLVISHFPCFKIGISIDYRINGIRYQIVGTYYTYFIFLKLKTVTYNALSRCMIVPTNKDSRPITYFNDFYNLSIKLDK